jgi:hypothetical protein
MIAVKSYLLHKYTKATDYRMMIPGEMTGAEWSQFKIGNRKCGARDSQKGVLSTVFYYVHLILIVTYHGNIWRPVWLAAFFGRRH